MACLSGTCQALTVTDHAHCDRFTLISFVGGSRIRFTASRSDFSWSYIIPQTGEGTKSTSVNGQHINKPLVVPHVSHFKNLKPLSLSFYLSPSLPLSLSQSLSPFNRSLMTTNCRGEEAFPLTLRMLRRNISDCQVSEKKRKKWGVVLNPNFNSVISYPNTMDHGRIKRVERDSEPIDRERE